jgi:hypothetical protein
MSKDKHSTGLYLINEGSNVYNVQARGLKLNEVRQSEMETVKLGVTVLAKASSD